MSMSDLLESKIKYNIQITQFFYLEQNEVNTHITFVNIFQVFFLLTVFIVLFSCSTEKDESNEVRRKYL